MEHFNDTKIRKKNNNIVLELLAKSCKRLRKQNENENLIHIHVQ